MRSKDLGSFTFGPPCKVACLACDCHTPQRLPASINGLADMLIQLSELSSIDGKHVMTKILRIPLSVQPSKPVAPVIVPHTERDLRMPFGKLHQGTDATGTRIMGNKEFDPPTDIAFLFTFGDSQGTGGVLSIHFFDHLNNLRQGSHFGMVLALVIA